MKAGLIIPKKDGKEFSFGAIWEYGDPKILPETLGRLPQRVRNQGSDDTCVSRSFAVAREFQENVGLSEEYIFMVSKKLEGDFDSFGLDPKVAAKAIKQGVLEKTQAPYSFENEGRDAARPDRWPTTYEEMAKTHATENYFWIEKGYGNDLFDNIRLSMHKFKDENRVVVVGALWRNSWTYADKGIIPPFTLEKEGTPHAFTAIDFKKIDGKEYLVTQNSLGEDAGDRGCHYFDRATVNKEFLFAIMFKDAPNETKESIIIKSQWIRAGFYEKALMLAKSFFQIFWQDRLFGSVRSSKWSKIRREHLAKFPECAVCGKKGKIVANNVHHCIPVHIDKSRELDIENNLITLCREDHFTFGHLKSWASYEKDIKNIAKEWREKIKTRP